MLKEHKTPIKLTVRIRSKYVFVQTVNICTGLHIAAALQFSFHCLYNAGAHSLCNAGFAQIQNALALYWMGGRLIFLTGHFLAIIAPHGNQTFPSLCPVLSLGRNEHPVRKREHI